MSMHWLAFDAIGEMDSRLVESLNIILKSLLLMVFLANFVPITFFWNWDASDLQAIIVFAENGHVLLDMARSYHRALSSSILKLMLQKAKFNQKYV